MQPVLIECPGDRKVVIVNGHLVYAEAPVDPACRNETYDADWVAEQLARAAGVGVRVCRVRLPGDFAVWDEDGPLPRCTPEDVRDWWVARCEAQAEEAAMSAPPPGHPTLAEMLLGVVASAGLEAREEVRRLAAELERAAPAEGPDAGGGDGGYQRRPDALEKPIMTPVDVPVDEILLKAMGYSGKARFVAVYFGAGDESYAEDGLGSMTCDPHAYLQYVRSPACLALAPFNLGSSDYPAESLLILDRREARAYVAPVAEARRFLREQHQESAPTGPVTLSEADMQAVMDHLRRELEARPMPTPAEIMASLQEQYRLHRELVAWLDATPQALAGREAIRRMVEGDNGGGEKKEEHP